MAVNSKALSCSCKHGWMDRQYGNGIRVHNKSTKNSKENNTCWRCCVCKKEHSIVEATTKSTTKKGKK